MPKSLEQLLKDFQQQGYHTELRTEQQLIDQLTALLAPFYRDGALEPLLKENLAGRLPLDDYLAWFNKLPEEKRHAIQARWGSPEKAALFLPEKNPVFSSFLA